MMTVQLQKSNLGKNMLLDELVRLNREKCVACIAPDVLLECTLARRRRLGHEDGDKTTTTTTKKSLVYDHD